MRGDDDPVVNPAHHQSKSSSERSVEKEKEKQKLTARDKEVRGAGQSFEITIPSYKSYSKDTG